MVAVYPRLIERVGIRLDLLIVGACVGAALLPQADRACGGICIQGIVGVYIVRQLFQQGCVLRRKAVQEVLCELRVINRCGLPVLKELADVLCVAFAKILPGLVGRLHLVREAVYQLFSHGIGQPVSENAPPDIQGVAQLMGDRGEVVCDSGADAVVAPVILAANSGASDMALGDVQSKVVPDLLHDLRNGLRRLSRVANSGSLPPLRVGRGVGRDIVIHHVLNVAFRLCGGNSLFAGRIQFRHDLGFPHAGGNQLVSLCERGSSRLFQFLDSGLILCNPGLRGLHHRFDSVCHILQSADGAGGIVHIHGAAILADAAQEHISFAGDKQLESGKRTDLRAALGIRLQVKVLFSGGDNSRSCGLALRVGVAAYNEYELISCGVLAACKVLFELFQRDFVGSNLTLRLFDALLGVQDFLCVGAFQHFQIVDLLGKLELLHDKRVVRSDSGDFSRRQCQIAVAGSLAPVVLAGHDLVDEGSLALQVVPLAAVKGLFRDIGIYGNFIVDIALPQAASFVLLQIAGAVRGVQLMHSDNALLCVHADAHCGG